MVKKSRSNNLLEGDIPQTLKKMTMPMIWGMVMLMTFSLVDTFFVSMLGTSELAAISFTFPVTFTIISLNIGLGIGTSAIIGKYLGSGESEHAKSIASGAIMLSVVLVGILAFVAYIFTTPIFSAMGATEETMPFIQDYMGIWFLSGVFLAVPMVGNSVLRANGDTKTPSIIMAVGGGINAVLDPLLIFGLGPIPAFGIQGAAIATAVAWAICVVWILYLLAVQRQLIEPKLLNFNDFKQASSGVLRIGLPAAGANMLTPIAGAIVTAIVASYGTEAVAAWGVGSRLESLACLVVLALSMSLPPFLSQNFGANKWARIEEAYLLCMKVVMAWQFFVYVLMVVCASALAGVFADEEIVQDYIKLFLFIVPLGYGFQGIVILTNSSFNAMHLPMSALILSVIRLFACFIPIVYLGSNLFGLFGLFWGCVIANLITAVISYMWFKRLLIKNRSENIVSEVV
ncbi:MATE family efflux transporter [Agaribacter marinus]|uniref:MATE family efflux transporter n=1 Tax=Agaribacter marinus TaxID=1431249 RepID=UPI0024E0E88F|nr:MATE family efflux transporter [Agaribacter marinus]